MINSQLQTDCVENHVSQTVQSTAKDPDECESSMIINTANLQEPSTSQTNDIQHPSEPTNSPTRFNDEFNCSIDSTDSTDTCSESSAEHMQTEEENEDAEMEDFSYQDRDDCLGFNKVYSKKDKFTDFMVFNGYNNFFRYFPRKN